MVISAGKSRKNVDAYILLHLTPATQWTLLIQTRSAVVVPDANPYVFARLSTNTPLSGNAELQEVVRECPGVKCPERITSTLLCRYITTVSQVCISSLKHIINFPVLQHSYLLCCILRAGKKMTEIMKTDAMETRSNPKHGETCVPFGGC